jgi:hypothetical protein
MPVLYETDPTTKKTLELTELSVLEEHIGRKFDFLGSNAWESNQILAYNSSTQSLFDKFVTLVIRTSPELRETMREAFVNDFIGGWAKFHERNLQDNIAGGISKQGYYMGEKLSLADLKTVMVVPMMRKLSGDRFISEEKTPGILKVCEMVEADERYKKWTASDDLKLFNEVTKQRFGIFGI